MGTPHVLAAATGAILTYGWLSITRMISGTTALGVPTTTVDVVGQIFLLLGILALIGTAWHRSPVLRARPRLSSRRFAKMR